MARLPPHTSPHLELPALGSTAPAPAALLPRLPGMAPHFSRCFAVTHSPPPCLQTGGARKPKLSPRALLPIRAGLGTWESPLDQHWGTGWR